MKLISNKKINNSFIKHFADFISKCAQFLVVTNIIANITSAEIILKGH